MSRYFAASLALVICLAVVPQYAQAAVPQYAQAAAAPSCRKETQDGQLCQQQLTNLHTLYDQLERSDVAGQGDLGAAQSEIAKWKAYYDACAKDVGWVCGPWPAAKPVPAPAPASAPPK